MLFHKNLHNVQVFVKKPDHVPCCRRRVCLLSGQTPGLYAHRVSRVNNTRYAVPDQAGHSASGRVVPDILFGEKVARSATFSPKRSKLNQLFPQKVALWATFWGKSQITYHAAAGESAVHSRQPPRFETDRVTRVNKRCGNGPIQAAKVALTSTVRPASRTDVATSPWPNVPCSA